jgi:hypothetical protein
MATIVNNPGGTTEDSSAGVVIGIVIALLIIVLFFAFALPYIRNNGVTPGVPNTGSNDSTVNIDLPDVNTGGSGSVDTGSGNGTNTY